MTDQTNPTNKFHALLIGIDCYLPNRLSDGSSYRSLRGCVRDINHVEAYLLNTRPETQIFKLTASNVDGSITPKEPLEQLPTYKNIVKKFQELTRVAQIGDFVYIHYSGHGGRTKTNYPKLKGDDGVDETLVPTDIGKPEGQYLRDIELALILKRMVDKGLVVTVVLDSCHSGGAVRGASGYSQQRLLQPGRQHHRHRLKRPQSHSVEPQRGTVGRTQGASGLGQKCLLQPGRRHHCHRLR